MLKLSNNLKKFVFKQSSGDFYSAWEKKKLGELGEFHRGLSYDSTEVKDSGNLVLRSTNIQDGELFLAQDALQFVNKDIPERITLVNGDIAVCMANGSKRLVGKSASYDNTKHAKPYPITVGAFCSVLRPNSPITKYLLQTTSYTKEIDLLLAGSAINNLKNSDLEKIVFNVPSSLREQQKIAEFFSALDERINLTAEKIKLLKEQKQGYLQRVFSGDMAFTDDNGNPYPAWEKKKLRDVLNLHSGKDQKGFEDPDGQYPILATGGEIGRTNTPLCEEESVLIGRKGTIDKPKYMETPFRTVDTLFYTTMKEGINAKFIYVVVQTVKWKKLSEASGVPSLNSSIILNVDCPVPSLPEQKKIAEFFSALDEQIELTESKLGLLKEQKKGYLQGIFG